MSRFSQSKKTIAISIIENLLLKHADEIASIPHIYLYSHDGGNLILMSNDFVKLYDLTKYIKNKSVTTRSSDKDSHYAIKSTIERVILLTDLPLTELKSLKLQLC